VLGLLATGPLLLAADPAPSAAPATAAGAPAAAGAQPTLSIPSLPPRSLALEVTVIRFKPDSKDRVLQDFAFKSGLSNVLAQLQEIARSVDVLYHGVRDLVLEEKAKASFDATETRPVLLIGQPAVPVPPATVYGLKLEVAVRPAVGDRFALFWEGSLIWSPELMDRRAAFQNTFQYLGKAASAAQSASQFTGGEARTTINQAADIGLALAQLFGPDKPGAGAIYELPVVKTVGLTGSRYCRSGETIVNATAAEAGTKEPQTVFILLQPAIRD
jgi:hypothetical protein